MRRPFALSIVVPVYNGEKSVGALVDALASLEVPGGHEVVLVNDGSPDNSLAVCREIATRRDIPVMVIDLARNFGEHNAVMAGLSHARGDYAITMDDDLQNPPSEVVRLFLHARDHQYDAVYTFYEKKQHHWFRNLGSRFTNWVSDILLDKPKGLYLSSFRCVSAFVIEQITRHKGPYPYIDGLIFQVTQKVGRLKVAHLPRAEGRSNYTLSRLIRLWLSMFLNFSVMPLRAASFVGLGTGFLGFVVFLIVLIEALRGNPPPGWASVMAATLVLAGVQLVMLGVIGEYLGRIFLAVNDKPQFIVREITRGGEVEPVAVRPPSMVAG